MSDDINQTGGEPFEIPATPRTAMEMASEFNWISLSAAVKFLDRFKKVLEPEAPLDALLSALRSGLVSAQCEASRTMEGSPNIKIHTARDLAPRDWSEATNLNIWDNAINLRDGTPASGIEISKYGLYHWLSQRGSDKSQWIFADFGDFAEECGIELISSDIGQIVAIEIPPVPKNKGGRPFTYNWSPILIRYLVDALYSGTLTLSTSKNEIGRQISAAAQAASPLKFPDWELARDHWASQIQDALKASDAKLGG